MSAGEQHASAGAPAIIARPDVRVAVVDYGMGNLRSVVNALQRVADGSTVYVAHDAEALRRADRVVFPGQGAMPDCMRHLHETGMADAVAQAARSKPFFGVCMGEQMLFGPSEEGDSHGMGLLPGRVVRFAAPAPAAPSPVVQPAASPDAPDESDVPDAPDAAGARLKVPHMGWNRVHRTRGHALWDGIDDGEFFYFVHSYHVVPDDAALVAATTAYGLRFTCAIAADNVFATQFHPEKSADSGLRLYRNFLRWQP